MKHYDLQKAKKIVKENKKLLVSASLGMHEDWFWTANTIFENGAFTELAKGRKKEIKIGGITGSFWATPVIQLELKDGSEKFLECFYETKSEFDEKPKPAFLTMGVLSGPVQDSIPPIEK